MTLEGPTRHALEDPMTSSLQPWSLVTLLFTPEGSLSQFSLRLKIRWKQKTQLSPTVPLETFPIFKSWLLHAVVSLHYQGPTRDIAPERVVANSLGTSLTRHGTSVNHTCPPSMLSELHSSGPCLTRHRVCVNHTCPSSFSFTLAHWTLDGRLSSMTTLPP